MRRSRVEVAEEMGQVHRQKKSGAGAQAEEEWGRWEAGKHSKL